MNVLTALVRDFGGLVVLLFAIGLIAVTFAFPFMCFSVVGNLRRIRRALERIADASESGRPGGSGSLLGL